MMLGYQRDAAKGSKVWFWLLLQLVFASVSDSQDSARFVDQTADTSTSCWGGIPRQRCRIFLITELGYQRRFLRPAKTFTVATNPPLSYKTQVTSNVVSFEAGSIAKVSTRSAVGLTAFIEADDADPGIDPIVGTKLRYRRWLNQSGLALDVGAGLESRPSPIEADLREPPGLTSDVALSARDIVSMVLRYDQPRLNGKSKPEISFGVRLGSKPGLFTALGVALTWATFTLAFNAVDGGNW